MWDVVEHAAEDVVVRELEKGTAATYTKRVRRL